MDGPQLETGAGCPRCAAGGQPFVLLRAEGAEVGLVVSASHHRSVWGLPWQCWSPGSQRGPLLAEFSASPVAAAQSPAVPRRSPPVPRTTPGAICRRISPPAAGTSCTPRSSTSGTCSGTSPPPPPCRRCSRGRSTAGHSPRCPPSSCCTACPEERGEGSGLCLPLQAALGAAQTFLTPPATTQALLVPRAGWKHCLGGC